MAVDDTANRAVGALNNVGAHFSSELLFELFTHGALMPLFSCKDCGMRIERSMATYWKHKGQVLCSSCQDRRDETQQADVIQAKDDRPPNL